MEVVRLVVFGELMVRLVGWWLSGGVDSGGGDSSGCGLLVLCWPLEFVEGVVSLEKSFVS